MKAEDMQKSFKELSEGTRDAVKLWILTNLYRTKNLGNHTSYGMKHWLQSDTGIYITQAQMDDALEECHFSSGTKEGKTVYRCGYYKAKGLGERDPHEIHDAWRTIALKIGADSDF